MSSKCKWVGGKWNKNSGNNGHLAQLGQTGVTRWWRPWFIDRHDAPVCPLATHKFHSLRLDLKKESFVPICIKVDWPRDSRTPFKVVCIFLPRRQDDGQVLSSFDRSKKEKQISFPPVAAWHVFKRKRNAKLMEQVSRTGEADNQLFFFKIQQNSCLSQLVLYLSAVVFELW